MTRASHEITRLKQILLSTRDRRHLDRLKRLVRKWQSPGAPGQDAVNRALIRSMDELHQRLDGLLRI